MPKYIKCITISVPTTYLSNFRHRSTIVISSYFLLCNHHILWLRNCSQFSFIIKQHDVSFFKINKAYLYNTTKSNLYSPPSRILCLPSWKVVVYCNICTSTQLYQIHTNNVGRYILDILYSYHYMSERKLNQVRRLIEIVDPGIWSPCIFK